MVRLNVAAAALAAALAAMPAKADVVTDWAEFGRVVSAGDRQPQTPETYYNETRLALAMFEAANAIDRKYESFLGMEKAQEGASMNAAVITAAYTVLAAQHPSRSADLDGSYELAIAQISDASARDKGVAIGKKAAEAALASGAFDASRTVVPYRPRTSPGVWVPVSLPSVMDEIGNMTPWVISDIETFMPPPPPALTSEVWARDLNEVKRLGGRKSTERTSVQSRIARYRITPIVMPTLRAIADLPGRSTVQNARMFALVNLAGDDTSVVTFAAKLRYNFWRPITAIRNADDDGNPATATEADWQPFIGTPNFPEYPCAHCSGTAAIAEVLKAEVGNEPAGGVQIGSRSLDYSAVQVLPTFDQWVSEVSMSRTLGGVHYRFSNIAGEDIGRAVARVALTKLRPLPPSD